MLATLRLRQKNVNAGAAAVESALTRFRTDPWTMTRYMDRAIQLAKLIGTNEPPLGRRMFAALEQPFAVYASEENRLVTRAEMTRQLDFPGLCGPAVGALEPHVPWTESFLRLRRDCYQATNNPLLPIAEEQLNEFLENSTQPLIAP